MGLFDITHPFCTCPSSENLVDGLPLAIHFDAKFVIMQTFIERKFLWIPIFQSFHICRLQNQLVRGRKALTTDAFYRFQIFENVEYFFRKSKISESPANSCSNPYEREPNHTRSLRDPIRLTWNSSILLQCWLFLIETMDILQILTHSAWTNI